MKKLGLAPVILALAACTSNTETVVIPAPSACASTVAEIAECAADMATTSPVTITGDAKFYKRTVKVGTYLTLAAPINTPLPIQFAEVRVLDGSDNVIQCGSTDAGGNLMNVAGTGPLQISGNSGTYKVQVLARSNHTISPGGGKTPFQFYVSVKKDLCTNEVQSVSGNVTLPGPAPVHVLAYARESETSGVIQGGAFNILNDIFTTYSYLGSNTGSSDLTCLNPKLNVYWQAGFNPAQYIYTTQDPGDLNPLSFYLRGYNELYINGGKLGDVATADTDHFDDAVIIHETGHHIEDVCGKMDSPGGTHYGLFRIDPRLAWSEGWGNFMGAHIVKNNIMVINPEITGLGTNGWTYYLDTAGYSESLGQSSANQLIRLNLVRPGSNPENPSSGYYYDKVDGTNNPGEGHFREVSVARSLFKITNTCTALCSNTNIMDHIWSAIEKTGLGMGQAAYSFRSSVLFYNRLTASYSGTLPAAVTSTINTDEAQQKENNGVYSGSWPGYGVKLAASGSTCPMHLLPKRQAGTVSNANEATTQGQDDDELSDQRFSDHFYRVDLSGLPGVTQINMSFSKNAGSTLDLDLILYQEGYRYVNETCSTRNASGICTLYSKTQSSSQFIRSDRSFGGSTRSLTGINLLGSSAYLLDVRAFTAGTSVSASTDYTYQLTDQNGGYLCPSGTY